jgi:hypothetical protein
MSVKANPIPDEPGDFTEPHRLKPGDLVTVEFLPGEWEVRQDGDMVRMMMWGHPAVMLKRRSGTDAMRSDTVVVREDACTLVYPPIPEPPYGSVVWASTADEDPEWWIRGLGQMSGWINQAGLCLDWHQLRNPQRGMNTLHVEMCLDRAGIKLDDIDFILRDLP